MSFPTKENPQPCKNTCGTKIYLSNQSGRYLPYELDGNLHHCPKKNGNGQTKDKKEITLEMVQHKLESIGIIINFERLMKEE